ncbi:MAG: hypothetical protein E6Q73_04500 [Pseudorhodobacter sp.]|nr:MAG: hypothetical protein E6Q73_04500 [Pseudorhodobacter sp.]
MAYAFPGAGALDYSPCSYAASRLTFRGPKADVKEPFISCIGGTETYGKFIPTPYPDLMEEMLDVQVANFGCMNAGAEVFVQESGLLQIISQGEACVVQITGAQNVMNRYYSVHPRRNDRFTGPTPLLRALFREVDFTEFSFTRHLLQVLQAQSADRFEVLAEELRAAWVARMTDLLGRIDCPTVLLWLGDAAPPQPGRRADLTRSPMLVDAEMIAAIKSRATTYLEFVPSAETRAKGAEGMAFGPLEAQAAASLPGPAVHYDLAKRLVPVLRQLI